MWIHAKEIAQTFKEQGNEYFKGKRYREGLGFYTQGMDAKPDDVQLKEALLLNRAVCNLKLQHYGSVLRDCATVIAARPRASKAYYRAGLALLALERVDEALDVCTYASEGVVDDPGFKTLRARAEKKREESRRKEEEQEERMRRIEEGKRMMDIAFAERNLINVPNQSICAEIRSGGTDGRDADPARVFLYLEHATSDVIPEFVEHTTFGVHLAVMLPPDAPTSSLQPYKDDGSLVIYAMTRWKGLLKVGRKMTLCDVCRAAGGSGADGKGNGLEVKMDA